MRLSSLLLLPSCLLSAVFAAAEAGDYGEHLHLKPLQGGHLYAGFTFNATTPLSSYDAQHFRFFPRSLGQILQYTQTSELHLRFSLGRWDEESWGSRPRSGLREGGNGVELWAWLEGDNPATVEERWSDLVNSLSGLFCASLNFIDSSKTSRPMLTFDPEGTLNEFQLAKATTSRRALERVELLHGMLPHEVVCTENLTPFLKLLPCKGKTGISSLLDGHKVFDADWQTMSVDVRPICSAGTECFLELQQTVDMVLDLERAMRPADARIPRPPPIEEVLCDESRAYHASDTCYPKTEHRQAEWSLSRVFGRPIKGSCSLSDVDAHDVALDVPSSRSVEVLSASTLLPSASNSTSSRSYKLPEGLDFDLSLPYEVIDQEKNMLDAPLHASRQMTGYGQERGGMHSTIVNPHPCPQRVVYLESLPWFLRPLMHTLRVDGATIEKMYYTPLRDRKRGTHLELLLEIPPHSTVEVTYDFEKAILRYTEYPPDANRGFDIPAAVIRVLPSSAAGGQGSYLRTTSLLLPLPTPDFSMPYNVIILTSTVIALGFGNIFTSLVRRFVLVEEVPTSPLVANIRGGVARLKDLVTRLKTPQPAKLETTVNGEAKGQGGKDS